MRNERTTETDFCITAFEINALLDENRRTFENFHENFRQTKFLFNALPEKVFYWPDWVISSFAEKMSIGKAFFWTLLVPAQTRTNKQYRIFNRAAPNTFWNLGPNWTENLKPRTGLDQDKKLRKSRANSDRAVHWS